MKKTTEKKVSIILEKREMLDILERFERILNDEEQDVGQIYKIVGKETEQATDWKTDELLWEDEEKTIPKYRDRYDYVAKTDDEMTEKDFARLSAISKLRETIEKMI